MKRFFTALLALILVLSLAVPALADIAYEPQDSFYRKHAGACVSEERPYFANGADGCVLIYTSPTGSAQAAVPNGTSLWIYLTYNDRAWGQLEYDPDDPVSGNWSNYVSGWVRMSDLAADYDYIAFAADHQSEFFRSERTLKLEPGEVAYLYKYPGSGVVKDTLNGDYVREELNLGGELFTDPAGREWAFISYYMGRRNSWVCLSDPGNDALEPDENFATPELIPAASASDLTAAVKAAKSPNAYLYAGAAGVVVIAAAVLIVTLRRKKHR